MSGIVSEPLDIDGPRRPRPQWDKLEAVLGTVVRHRSFGYVGQIIRFGPDWLTLREANGREHILRVERGAFSHNGKTVNLVQARRKPSTKTSLTASGSVAMPNVKARIALPSRILVEGRHDAELVEKVWGDDLRIEGVVVEPLHGADDLAEVVRSFGPRPGRRLGILLDHLVDHSKETRIAGQIDHPDVLITGHPYVDIWQAIRPSVLGIEAWPVIPKGTDWKTGVCKAFGFSGESGQLWQRMLGRVNTFTDLEPPLVGAVEQLIDFVAPPTQY